MAISMVRKPSETPNINNIDDIIPFRYAYGNQNGYVIGRGAEISHTVNGNQFTINSGRLVIQGVESDIDANGVTLTIDSINETRYYVVYYEVNLATNTANIKLSDFDTAGYPTIDIGDDLTSNSNGIARLPLYRFTANSGVISGVEKVVNAIKYTEDIKTKNAIQADKSTQADNATNTQKVQNVDLSLSGQAKFGNNIILKAVELLNSTNGVKTFTFSNSVLNKKLKIEYGSVNEHYTAEVRFITNDTTVWIEKPLLTSSEYWHQIIQLKLNNNIISITVTDISGNSRLENNYFYIFKIYEIIE